MRPGVFLSVDYTNPGAIETFTATGRLLWRYEPHGAHALDQPSLALPLPNGDVLANDDKNERVIVVDPTPTGSSGSTATPTKPVRGRATWQTPTVSISRRRTP